MKFYEGNFNINQAKKIIFILIIFSHSVYKCINIEKLNIQHFNNIKKIRYNNEIIHKTLNNTNESKQDTLFRKRFIPSNNKMICDENRCDYCCINRYQCGSKTKCEYYRMSYKIFYYLFSFVCFVLVIFIIYKIADSSNKPIHRREDAIDTTNLETFKDLFLKKAQFKQNNKNF